MDPSSGRLSQQQWLGVGDRRPANHWHLGPCESNVMAFSSEVAAATTSGQRQRIGGNLVRWNGMLDKSVDLPVGNWEFRFGWFVKRKHGSTAWAGAP